VDSNATLALSGRQQQFSEISLTVISTLGFDTDTVVILRDLTGLGFFMFAWFKEKGGHLLQRRPKVVTLTFSPLPSALPADDNGIRIVHRRSGTGHHTHPCVAS
jgi:hypothetical protein